MCLILPQGCCIIEVACLAYLGFRIIHLASFQHKIEFWKDKKNIVAIVLLSVSYTNLTFSPDSYVPRESQDDTV